MVSMKVENIYLKRKIDAYLESWRKSPARKPLLVKGARQIGKTEAIEHFAAKHYRSFVEINFVESPEYASIINDGYSVENVVKRITLINPEFKFIPGETLIFFDEIQECPDVATSFKFFCKDGRFDVIASGSLLRFHYKGISSNSVGFKADYTMYSLDFAEFLEARGYGEDRVEEIFAHLVEQRPFSEVELNVYQRLFREYAVLGGMPEVVRAYIVNKSFEGTLAIQKTILEGYEDDIRKYAEGMDQTRIVNVFRSIPAQLAKENKKFQISKVAKDARFKDYRGCVDWLSDAGIVTVCNCLNFPELPLKGNCADLKFKLYMADSGLLVAQLDEEAQLDLRANENLGVYKGALYENIAAEAIVKSGGEPFYYRREDSTLEMDFFLRTANKLVPVEVKSTRGRSQSLGTLIKSDHYPDITWGIKLHAGNIGFENNILTLPSFTAFLLRRLLKEHAIESEASPL